MLYFILLVPSEESKCIMSLETDKLIIQKLDSCLQRSGKNGLDRQGLQCNKN